MRFCRCAIGTVVASSTAHFAFAGGPAPAPTTNATDAVTTAPIGQRESASQPGTATTAPTTSPTENPGDDTRDADDPKAIAALINQLHSDDWSERQTAQDQLIAIGSPAADALRDAVAKADDEELRQRASAVLAQISEDAVTGASIITLHERNVSARDLFTKLARQADTTFEIYPPNLWDQRPVQNVSIDIDGKPFWDAIREITDATGIDLRPINNDLRLTAMQGGLQIGRRYVSGPFMIALQSASRQQSINYANDSRQSSFSMNFMAMVEPKIRVLRVANSAKVEEATDEQGASLLFAGSDRLGLARAAMFESVMLGSSQGLWQFSTQLAYNPQQSRTLKVLRGSINVQVQTASELVEVPDVLNANNVVRIVSRCRFTMVDVKKTGDRFALTASIGRDAANGAALNRPMNRSERMDWERVQNSLNDIKLVDDQGRPLTRVGYGNSATDGATQVTITFVQDVQPGFGGNTQRVNEPAKMLWSVPTESRDERIPFEFRDIPLPN